MNIFSQLAALPSKDGFEVLVVVVFGVMLFTSGVDLYLTAKQSPTVGDYVNAFVSTRPWIAVVGALVFGAMIAHFFIYIAHG